MKLIYKCPLCRKLSDCEIPDDEVASATEDNIFGAVCRECHGFLWIAARDLIVITTYTDGTRDCSGYETYRKANRGDSA